MVVECANGLELMQCPSSSGLSLLLQDDEIMTSSQMVERLTMQTTELEDSIQELGEENRSLRSRNGLLAQEIEAVQEEVSVGGRREREVSVGGRREREVSVGGRRERR